jgi:hypothetical protein
MGNGFGKFRRNNIVAVAKKYGAPDVEIEAIRNDLDKRQKLLAPAHKHLRRKLREQLEEKKDDTNE